MYKDKKGHFTDKEHDGAECPHDVEVSDAELDKLEKQAKEDRVKEERAKLDKKYPRKGDEKLEKEIDNLLEDDPVEIMFQMEEEGVDIKDLREVKQYLGATLGLDREDQDKFIEAVKNSGEFDLDDWDDDYEMDAIPDKMENDFKRYCENYDVDLDKAKKQFLEHVDRYMNKEGWERPEAERMAYENTLDNIVMGDLDEDEERGVQSAKVNPDEIIHKINEEEQKRFYIDHLKEERQKYNAYLNHEQMLKDRNDLKGLNDPKNRKKYDEARKQIKDLDEKIDYFEKLLKDPSHFTIKGDMFFEPEYEEWIKKNS